MGGFGARIGRGGLDTFEVTFDKELETRSSLPRSG